MRSYWRKFKSRFMKQPPAIDPAWLNLLAAAKVVVRVRPYHTLATDALAKAIEEAEGKCGDAKCLKHSKY